MKLENPAYVKRTLTDTDRDTCLKLINCGLSNTEIVNIMHISLSTIQYIKQAHKACVNQDWNTLQKLSTCVRPTVDWAMKITGTDKAFLETFGKPKEQSEPVTGPTVDYTAVPDPITREDFLGMYATMQDIRSLLVEIRDILK